MEAHAGTPERPTGWYRWVSTTNHKDIGTLYLIFSLIMFLIAGVMILLVRAELYSPGLQFMSPVRFNQLITMHGTLMIFTVIMTAGVGFANWMIPLLIGAPDMALPRLNNFSFWILPFGATLLMATWLAPGGPPQTGWSLYAPLSIEGGMGTDLDIFGLIILGISSVLGAINIIVTILNMRAPEMTLMRMPMFAWAWLVTAYLVLGVLPELSGTLAMVFADRHLGTHFFNAAGGGDPVLYQHLFWFFGHPEVYIMILPAFGIISQIIPTFARKPLFGYTSMVYAIMAIGFLSFIVWGHHMFTSGMFPTSSLFFMYTSMLIAVPTGIKVFNWLATIWRGATTFETPMLFALGFVLLFTVGGLSGVMMALVPADQQYHNTYFIVAHFHYVLFTGAGFALLAGAYYWLPKWTGHMYNETLGKWHFWLTAIFANITFFPQHFLGLAGMPRRVPDYALQFEGFNRISTIGSFGLGLAQLLFVYLVWRTVHSGRPATDRVWEGARGLEWTIPSPAPYHSFPAPPHLGPDTDVGLTPRPEGA